jgi:23S rRNA (guanosine2251-2'-O)-methyltransferase
LGRGKSKRSNAKTGTPGRPGEGPRRRDIRGKAKRSMHPTEIAVADGGRRPDATAPASRSDGSGVAVLYGFHAVREAIRAGRRKVLGLYVTPAAAAKLAGEIARAGLRPRLVEGRDITLRLGPGAVHQGVLLEAFPLPSLDLSDIVAESGIVLVLDQITDPHNVGAILRSAAAFGADAVIMTKRHAPEMAGVVAKAASGGLEHVGVITVANLAHALERLGEDDGYLRVGLDSEAPQTLASVLLRRPVALVLGGEGKGLRRLTREKCDLIVRLDSPGAIQSLNVSIACAVALAFLRSSEPK